MPKAQTDKVSQKTVTKIPIGGANGISKHAKKGGVSSLPSKTKPVVLTGKAGAVAPKSKASTTVDLNTPVATVTWELVTTPERPKFGSTVKSNGTDGFNLATDNDVDQKQNLEDFNAAVPHRMDWSSLRDNTMLFVNRKETKADFVRWTDRFVTASTKKLKKHRLVLDKTKSKPKIKVITRVIKRYTAGEKKFLNERSALIKIVENDLSIVKDRQRVMEKFLSAFNSLPVNVPDIGAHNGSNLQVSNRPHLNAAQDGSLSPMSEQLGFMSPHRLGDFPFSPNGEHVVTTNGLFVDPDLISNQYGSFKSLFKNRKSINAKEFEFDSSEGFVQKSSEEEEDDEMDVDKP